MIRLVVSSLVLKNIKHLKTDLKKNRRITPDEPLPDTILTVGESGKVWTPLPLLIVVTVNFHPFSLFDNQHTGHDAPTSMLTVEVKVFGFLSY